MWNRNFLLVVIGQIISLLGNAILRFALPLYLLNETGSVALFGLVSACAFMPMIILSPIGGVFADRVNKRNIMVVLDFVTACIVLSVALLIDKMDVVVLILSALFMLYGIQGAYQPAVQASIPILLKKDYVTQGNAVINLVNSISGLIGPVFGGVLFGFKGIMPILYVSSICFFASAIMEIYIQIPFEKKTMQDNIFKSGLGDLKESIRYMCQEQPLIIRFSLTIAAVNMILSALITIGLPVVVTQIFDFESEMANRLYGYAQGVMALGTMCGGMVAGILSRKMKTRKGFLLLFYDALTLIPIGFAVSIPMPDILCYVIVVISCFIMMAFATMFSIVLMSYLQKIVPTNLLGKVISCVMCFGMCASPIGQAVYGILFDILHDCVCPLFFIASAITVVFAFSLKKSFIKLEKLE